MNSRRSARSGSSRISDRSTVRRTDLRALSPVAARGFVFRPVMAVAGAFGAGEALRRALHAVVLLPVATSQRDPCSTAFPCGGHRLPSARAGEPPIEVTFL